LVQKDKEVWRCSPVPLVFNEADGFIKNTDVILNTSSKKSHKIKKFSK
jgi:hypothetical protein